MRRPVDTVFSVRRVALLGLLLFCGSTLPEAAAQRPLRVYDPFYRDETARRIFFDRYALTAEVSYRPAGFIQSDGDIPSPNADPFALGLRFDYQLSSRFDLAILMDAVGGTAGRKLAVNWVALKYYRTVDTQDYAFRLAVDPASEGRVGFPQMDLAFLYTSPASPTLTTDFALGLRRIRIGYQQLVRLEVPPPDPDDPVVTTPADRALIRTRALGWEAHLMMSYNILFDPAGSNLFVTFLGEAGRYDLIELGEVGPDGRLVDADGERTTTRFRGGVIWVRTGLEFDRPAYQIAPYMAVPLRQWHPDEGEWPSARLHIGARLMLR
ncbi:hypothetical protein GQ464_000555 [Rhodocaloribacter litoris]|uniref:hypothetical protein n=1 Tax=Rhodocaloribacter litoris TaxID=2558931 RepID=UPI00141E760D|nr:hypothetical protein [Rhodocaloribacter litoris]QXD15478.1 hypothetical protein GQ464_000555 [Rhodocaloribacter litoris]